MLLLNLSPNYKFRNIRLPSLNASASLCLSLSFALSPGSHLISVHFLFSLLFSVFNLSHYYIALHCIAFLFCPSLPPRLRLLSISALFFFLISASSGLQEIFPFAVSSFFCACCNVLPVLERLGCLAVCPSASFPAPLSL